MTANNKTIVGKVTSPYGVKGWVKIHSFTDPAENIFQFDQWSLEHDAATNTRLVTVEEYKQHGKGFVARLKDIKDRTAAEMICQRAIAVEQGELPKLSEGEYYWQQLIGLRVICNAADSKKSILLGEISDMMETGANDVMVVSPCAGSVDQRERLLPYVNEVCVLQVDLDNQQMLVDWDPDF
ncbi:MAG: ribosome maturation factor RimM [Pseudomonadales bacterium]